MANKIELQVDVKTELKDALKTSRKGTENLKNAGAFNSPLGEKTLNGILGILNRLEQVNLDNLSGTELTHFLTNLEKLRGMMDSAARSLTEYSEEFKKQQEAVDKAAKALREAKDIKSTKLQTKKDALENVKTQMDPSKRKHLFFNKDTGKEVFNPDTLADLYSKGKLEITGLKKGPVKDFEKIANQYGIPQYKNASKEVESANTEIKAKTAQLEIEELKLKGIEKPLGVNPLTQETNEKSQKILSTTGRARQAAQLQTEKEIKETSQAIGSQIKTLEGQSSALGRAFKQFTLYNLAVKGCKKAIREAVNTIKELDKELTEQAMVTGMTRKQTYQLIGTYQDLAIQCGATTKEIASVATEYMKQGKTIEDSLVLTEAAVKAAKVARVSVGDSVNYLTTALNGFRLSAEDAMLVSDKFAAVAAASATDYDELAIALSKVASQANLAGMSIDYTTALLTKGLETTREAPETMGTALKTIIARMRELGDYGETLEGDTDINNVETQLKYVGIALRGANGELRSTEDVLDELGRKWETLNTNQQAAVAKALAGTRQQSRLIAMMDDYERVIELQEISERSAGTTMAQAETLLQGMEAALNKISVSWEKISTTLVNSEAIIGLVDFGAEVLGGIGSILDTTAGQVGVYSTLAVLGANILGQKVREHEIMKAEADLQRQETIEKQEAYIKTLEDAELKDEIHALDVAQENELNALKEKNDKEEEIRLDEKLLEEKEIALTMYDQLEAKAKLNGKELDLTAKARINTLNAEKEHLQKIIPENKTKLQQLDEEYKDAKKITSEKQKALDTARKELSNTNETIKREQDKLQLFKEQNNAALGLLGIFTNLKSITKTALTPLKLIQDFTEAGNKKEFIFKKLGLEVKDTTEAIGEAGDATKKATGVMGTGVKAATLWWAALAIAIAAVIYKIAKDNSVKQVAEDVRQLSVEIYNLQQKNQGLSDVINTFEKIDNKVLKTTEDVQALGDALEKAKEFMTDDQIKVYESLKTDKAKTNYIKDVLKEVEVEERKKRKELTDKLYYNSLGGTRSNKKKLKLMQDKDINNAQVANLTDTLYRVADARGFSDVETDLATVMLGNLSDQELIDLGEKGVGDQAIY